MKRQSKAEEALSKQVKSITIQLTDHDRQIAMLTAQKATLFRLKDEIEIEIERLKQERLHASETRKP
jgi:hypothetical protein